VKSLVSNSIYAKKDTNGPPSANQDAAMLFAPLGCTHLPPPVPQNLSPEDIAGNDIMKLKVSRHLWALWVLKG